MIENKKTKVVWEKKMKIQHGMEENCHFCWEAGGISKKFSQKTEI